MEATASADKERERHPETQTHSTHALETGSECGITIKPRTWRLVNTCAGKVWAGCRIFIRNEVQVAPLPHTGVVYLVAEIDG